MDLPMQPNVSVPEALPTLSAGSHDAEHGDACVMEYVSLLAGEEWSDRPECTHPLLAHEARTANDLLRDSDRTRLVPLIGRLFGTTDDSPVLRAQLRIAQARQVATLLEPASRSHVLQAIDDAVAWLDTEGDYDDVQAAIAEAMALPRRTGDLDPAHTDFHLSSSRIFAFVLSPDLEAAEAYATKALVIAHLVAASGECRADCGNEPARARRMVKDLGALIDVYDDVTGRVGAEISGDQIRELASSLG